MIDVSQYMRSARVSAAAARRGGQELIAHEIAGCFARCLGVALPYCSASLAMDDALASALSRLGLTVRIGSDARPKGGQLPSECDGLYLGTPTIVDDAPLFGPPDAPPLSGTHWTKQAERRTVRGYCAAAREAGYRIIVTGLGSGEVTLEERVADMGDGTVVAAYKHFGHFEDWVLVWENPATRVGEPSA